MSIQLLMLVMVGGIGSIHGAIFGAVFLVLLPTVIAISARLFACRDCPAARARAWDLWPDPRARGAARTARSLRPLAQDQVLLLAVSHVQECDVQAPEDLHANGAPAVTILQVRDLAISFGAIKAVDGITFDVAAGEIFTIIGPNGAGKTTIFNLISRLYNSSGGKLVFDGEDITRVPPHEIAGVALRGRFRTSNFSSARRCCRTCCLASIRAGRPRSGRNCCSCREFVLPRRRSSSSRRGGHRFPRSATLSRCDRSHDLPYGVRKVIEIARALCAQPKLILLDEPSSGLNVEETEDVRSGFATSRDDLGITVLMVEHDMYAWSAACRIACWL